jgi:endonuclease/exonuclease/phosphatase (EEP) superfamily protein YafD
VAGSGVIIAIILKVLSLDLVIMWLQSLKIATWNLNHPKPNSWKKKPLIEAQIYKIDADIWVLTETNNEAIDLSSTHHKFTSREDEKHDAYTTVWIRSAFSGQLLKTFDPEIAACVSLTLPKGKYLVYGTILTWHGDRGQDEQSKNWEEHYKSIQAHGNDWYRLLQENPNSRMIVAGDFNQARDKSKWYGTEKGINLLTELLERNSLICLTDTVQPKLRHNIDHICVTKDWAIAGNPKSWEGTQEDVILSDHNGVYVEISV